MERKTTIKKNKEGYGYTYTDISAINKYCEENNITYYQEVETCETNAKDYIITYLTENDETKRYRGCQIVQSTLQGIKNPVQEYGSSLTYCRRYSLLMALGLATDDNDAQDLTVSTINTKEEALKLEITFGKYNGKKLEDILDDESYLKWLFQKGNDIFKKAVSLIMGWEIKSEEELKKEVEILGRFKILLSKTKTNQEEIYNYYGVENDTEMTQEQLIDAINILEKKLKKEENK